jgi:4-amino-4-deoxy-L-arabinose transferase-like glycosyltransferase
VLAAIIMIASTRGMSATCDEVAHLPAGYTYLAWGDFRLNPEHPPLVKALAAVPLVLFDRVAAKRESGPWQLALLQPKQQWWFGHDFLYSTPGHDADRLLAHARFPMVGVAVLLGVLVWIWTRELWGEVAAAAAVVAWALEPNLLAHGPLVATDVALATFSLGATYMLWRVCRELTVGNTLGLTLFVALAVVSKYSAVFLAPAMVAVLAVQVVQRADWTVRVWGPVVAVAGYARKAAVAVILLVVVAAAAWTATWGVFGFRFPAARGTVDRFPLQTELATLRMQGERPGGWQLKIVTPLLTTAANHRLLPEAFIYGFAAMLRDAQNRPSYLLGAIHQTGRWYYFLLAVLVKTPVPILLLAAWGAFLLLRHRGSTRRERTDRTLVFLPPSSSCHSPCFHD